MSTNYCILQRGYYKIVPSHPFLSDLLWFLLQLNVLFRHVIVVSMDTEILYSVSGYHTHNDLGVCRNQ